VLIHQLVQAVTVDQIPAELVVAWRQAAAAVIDSVIPGDTSSPESWLASATLLPHARAALADDSDGMARIANYLGGSRVSEVRVRVPGAEHPDTLTACGHLARWTGEAGDVAMDPLCSRAGHR